jgi:hypothetical protein
VRKIVGDGEVLMKTEITARMLPLLADVSIAKNKVY